MSMSREQFLATSGAQIHRLEFWLEQKWLIPDATSAGASFAPRDVARARLIHELETDFGVNDEGIDVILHLIDQLHGMRRAFSHLQAELGARPSEAPPGSQT
jgi:chaperone modulatory protein CbpM